MTKLTMIWLILALMVSGALADEQSHRAAAIRYVNSPSQQQVLDQMLSPEAFIAQMKVEFPEIPQDKLPELAAISFEEMKKIRPQMEVALIEACIKVMSEEEIVAVDEFYRTPLGASIAAKMQPMLQVSLQLIAPHLQEAQKQIGKRVADVMEK